MTASPRFDVLIVGAGPAGLALAQALKPLGLQVALVEQAPRASLADPAFDGREIALTQHSVSLLEQLGHGAVYRLQTYRLCVTRVCSTAQTLSR